MDQEKQNKKEEFNWIVIILVLIAATVFLGIRYFTVNKELAQAKKTIEQQQNSQKLLEFTDTFIQKVLQANTTVDFETRLKLENSVRNLGDQEILAQWQKFVDSKTEAEAQLNVKKLLGDLVTKARGL